MRLPSGPSIGSLILLGASLALAGVPPRPASGGARPGAAHGARITQQARLAKAYADSVRHWHAPSPGRACPVTPGGRPMLALEILNSGDHAELRADRDDGGFAAGELDRAARALHDTRTGNEYPVDARLLDLVYRIERHFDAQAIRVISGYRTPVRGRSNHGRGRAMDLIVPGVTDDDVAKFARSLGFVGVGIYPVSGFVHVDTRTRSYFWVDSSGPGQRNRHASILGGIATESDARAVARGEKPPLPWIAPGGDVQAPAHAIDQHDETEEDESGIGAGESETGG